MKVITFGRSKQNDVVLNDNFVSRFHFQIIQKDDGNIYLKDLNSRNGTYVNGIRTDSTILNKNDIVKAGNSIVQWQYYFQEEKEEVKVEEKTPAELYDYAGFWLRFVANLLDSAILYIPSLLIAYIIALLIYSDGYYYYSFTKFYVITSFVVSILSLLYYTLMESSSLQATVGKRILGIIVTDEYGERLTFGNALGRNIAKILSYITFTIGYMMAGWTEKKQALHDMAAGTLVVVKVNPQQ